MPAVRQGCALSNYSFHCYSISSHKIYRPEIQCLNLKSDSKGMKVSKKFNHRFLGFEPKAARRLYDVYCNYTKSISFI